MNRINQTALVEAVNFFLTDDLTWNFVGSVPEEFTQEDFKKIKWLNKGQSIHGDEVSLKSPVSYATFYSKFNEIRNRVAYERARKSAYPSVAEQLDMLWHAIDTDTLDKSSEFYTQLKSVKDTYPKV